MTSRRRERRTGLEGAEPLSPERKWRAITVATLLLVPGFWALLAGLVAVAADEPESGPEPAAAIALGLAIIPFVHIALAFMSGHPRAPGAVLRAMGLTLLVGIMVSAIAGDGVTGVVAGVGAGGIVALRADPAHRVGARVIAVALASVYVFVLVRTAGAVALLPAPIFPLTGIGIADHLSERRRQRETAAA
jgi:hypothetical protein